MSKEIEPISYKGHTIEVVFNRLADDADGRPSRELAILVDGEVIGTCVPIGHGGLFPIAKAKEYIDEL